MAKKRKLVPKEEEQTYPIKEEPVDDVQEEEEQAYPIKEEPVEDEDEQQTLTGVPAGATGDGDADEDEDDEDEDDEDEDDEDDSESVQKLLEPFPKDQLIDLLRDAAVKHPDVLESINKIADVDPFHRKIFVHGLGWDTNAETLTNAFKKYGEIEDCNTVTDKISGKSKGYGFILFKHRTGARKALKEPQKKIGNRMTACQLASAGPVPPPAAPVSEYTMRKIYVSNVSADIEPQKLIQFFAKYGEIEEGPLGLDKQTGKPKGFTLFVYKSVESARKALEDPHKNFEGHILHCQKAIDGPKPNKSQFGGHHQHHHLPGGGHGPKFARNENPNYMGNHSGGATGPGHLIAPSPPAGISYNQAVPPAALNPALGQALTALLATQGAGLGLTNLLGSLGSTGLNAPVNQNVPAPIVNNAGHGMQGGYGNQPVSNNMGPNVMGGYGNQPSMQGGYPNLQMGQGSAGRSQPGGHMGGVGPYMGH